MSVEFKERFTPKVDRDIVAFANTRGGFLLLGVDDNGKVDLRTSKNFISHRYPQGEYEATCTVVDVAPPGRLERPTHWLTASRSTTLSYGGAF